jgi:predicted transcriptional regulator
VTGVNGSTIQRYLSLPERRELTRALAVGEVTRASLARRYGISRAAVTQFAHRHAAEIDAIKAHLDDEFAGLWIASKEQRIVAHQNDYEVAAGHEKADHHEWIKARTQILHAVAEELGQLPPRTTVAVLPVVHIIEGVDTSALT